MSERKIYIRRDDSRLMPLDEQPFDTARRWPLQRSGTGGHLVKLSFRDLLARRLVLILAVAKLVRRYIASAVVALRQSAAPGSPRMATT